MKRLILAGVVIGVCAYIIAFPQTTLTVLSLVFSREYVKGRLFLLDMRDMTPDDLAVGEVVVRDVASRLLESWDRDDVILHGDLESKNILICHKRGLAAIDPLACVGEPAYDAAYCAASALPGGRRDERCGLVAAELGLDPERVRRWASVVALDHPC